MNTGVDTLPLRHMTPGHPRGSEYYWWCHNIHLIVWGSGVPAGWKVQFLLQTTIRNTDNVVHLSVGLSDESLSWLLLLRVYAWVSKSPDTGQKCVACDKVLNSRETNSKPKTQQYTSRIHVINTERWANHKKNKVTVDFRVEFLEVWWDCCDEHADCRVRWADLTASFIHQHLQHWNVANTVTYSSDTIHTRHVTVDWGEMEDPHKWYYQHMFPVHCILYAK